MAENSPERSKIAQNVLFVVVQILSGLVYVTFQKLAQISPNILETTQFGMNET